MARVDLISVHVPKCAGASLLTALERGFGADAVYRDYDDRPGDPTSPMNLDPEGFFERAGQSDLAMLAGKTVIHGHFHILKYQNVQAPFRITFLRDPVDRLISHYFFWQSIPRTANLLHQYCLDYKLSIDDFARLPKVRKLYTATYFAGVDMTMFQFIGFHDSYRDDYARLQRTLGVEIGMIVENTNTADNYAAKRGELLSDAARMRKIRDLLKDDLIFYEKLR